MSREERKQEIIVFHDFHGWFWNDSKWTLQEIYILNRYHSVPCSYLTAKEKSEFKQESDC